MPICIMRCAGPHWAEAPMGKSCQELKKQPQPIFCLGSYSSEVNEQTYWQDLFKNCLRKFVRVRPDSADFKILLSPSIIIHRYFHLTFANSRHHSCAPLKSSCKPRVKHLILELNLKAKGVRKRQHLSTLFNLEVKIRNVSKPRDN